jgi:hypothetical protein
VQEAKMEVVCIPEPEKVEEVKARVKSKLEILAESLRKEYEDVLAISNTIYVSEENKKKKQIIRHRGI